MTKKETFRIMEMIAGFYEYFSIDQVKVDAWHEVLKGYAYEKVKSNLVAFAAESPAAPKVSDLVRKSAILSRAVPNDENTHYLLYLNKKPASEKVVQENLKKMREILGIRRD